MGERTGQMDKLELKWFTAHLALADEKDTLVFVLALSECKGAFFLTKMYKKISRRFVIRFEFHGLS